MEVWYFDDRIWSIKPNWYIYISILNVIVVSYFPSSAIDWKQLSYPHKAIWIMSRNCGCLVTWFCYQLIAKPGNKTATGPWPDPYAGMPHRGNYSPHNILSVAFTCLRQLRTTDITLSAPFSGDFLSSIMEKIFNKFVYFSANNNKFCSQGFN